MRILDGRKSFYQWDINAKITSEDFKVGDEIHFCNACHTVAIVVKTYDFEGNVVADVPNILLQKTYTIKAYRFIKSCGGEITETKTEFEVTARPKPSDYIYTEIEILDIKTAVDKALLDAKESGGFKGEKGEKGEDGYTPQKYIDYYTEADQADMVKAVLAALPDGDEVSY